MEPGTLRQLGTLPNLLSLVRVPMAGLVWLAPANEVFVLSLMAAAALSDLLDGWVARRRGHPGDGMGAWLDPLCDKIFVVSTLAALLVTFTPPAWLVALAATREVVLFPLVLARFLWPRLRRAAIPWKALVLGKAATVLQFAVVLAVLADWRDGWWPLGVTCALAGLGAGLQYAWRAWRTVTPK